MIPVWFWFGSSLDGLAATMKRTFEPPHWSSALRSLAQNARLEQWPTASPLQTAIRLCFNRRGSPVTLRRRRLPRSVAQLVEHRSPKPGVAGSSPATPASERTELELKGVALVQNAGNADPGDWRKTKPLLKWSGSHPRQGLADSGAEVGLGAWGCAR